MTTINHIAALINTYTLIRDNRIDVKKSLKTLPKTLEDEIQNIIASHATISATDGMQTLAVKEIKKLPEESQAEILAAFQKARGMKTDTTALRIRQDMEEAGNSSFLFDALSEVYGNDPNQLTSWQDIDMAVYVAVSNGHIDVAQLLLTEDNQTSDDIKIKCIIKSIENNNPEMTRLLLSKTPEISNFYRSQALSKAVINNNLSVVELLLPQNEKKVKMNTSYFLEAAILNNNLSMVQYLFTQSQDSEKSEISHYLNLANDRNNMEIVSFFKKHKRNVFSGFLEKFSH